MGTANYAPGQPRPEPDAEPEAGPTAAVAAAELPVEDRAGTEQGLAEVIYALYANDWHQARRLCRDPEDPAFVSHDRNFVQYLARNLGTNPPGIPQHISFTTI